MKNQYIQAAPRADLNRSPATAVRGQFLGGGRRWWVSEFVGSIDH